MSKQHAYRCPQCKNDELMYLVDSIPVQVSGLRMTAEGVFVENEGYAEYEIPDLSDFEDDESPWLTCGQCGYNSSAKEFRYEVVPKDPALVAAETKLNAYREAVRGLRDAINRDDEWSRDNYVNMLFEALDAGK